MGSKYEMFVPTVKWLHSQKRTDQEIAECVGIDSRRVNDIRKRLGLELITPSTQPLILSDIQYQAIIGGIVGDMCIFKDKDAIYHRMNVAHSIKQRQYLLYKYHLLKDLFAPPSERMWEDKRTKNVYHEIRIQSKTHKIFSDLYAKWYKDGKKVIPDDIWNLTELGLAILYFDDGYKSSSGFEISLNDYSKKDIGKVAAVLREKFNLSCTEPGLGNSVYIKTESADAMREILVKHLVVGLEYKL